MVVMWVGEVWRGRLGVMKGIGVLKGFVSRGVTLCGVRSVGSREGV